MGSGFGVLVGGEEFGVCDAWKGLIGNGNVPVIVCGVGMAFGRRDSEMWEPLGIERMEINCFSAVYLSMAK
jgi:hypothetical protein